MYFIQDGVKYVFNEKESRASILAASKHLDRIHSYFDKKDMKTNYIIYLFAMKSLCEMQLKELGDDAIKALFYRRIRIERESKVEETTESEADVKPDNS